MFKSLATVARRSSGRIPALVVLPQRFTGTTPSAGTTISELVLDKTCEVDEALRICKAFATQAYDESILVRPKTSNQRKLLWTTSRDDANTKMTMCYLFLSSSL